VASAHGMGSGGLAVDAMAIVCLGVDRCGERFFVLSHFGISSQVRENHGEKCVLESKLVFVQKNHFLPYSTVDKRM